MVAQILRFYRFSNPNLESQRGTFSVDEIRIAKEKVIQKATNKKHLKLNQIIISIYQLLLITKTF